MLLFSTAFLENKTHFWAHHLVILLNTFLLNKNKHFGQISKVTHHGAFIQHSLPLSFQLISYIYNINISIIHQFITDFFSLSAQNLQCQIQSKLAVYKICVQCSFSCSKRKNQPTCIGPRTFIQSVFIQHCLSLRNIKSSQAGRRDKLVECLNWISVS